MGDEEDRSAVSTEAFQDREQPVALLGGQNGRGLVEDEDAGLPVQCLEDLDPLQLTHRELLDRRSGMDRQTIGVGQLGDRLSGGGAIEETVPGRLGPEDDVLGHGQRGEKLERLVDHAETGMDGIEWGAESDLLAPDPDGPVIGSEEPVEDRHERALPGAVLADDGMDDARLDGQIDPVVGHHAGVALGDPA